MSFARYPAYKDSGVEWLGVVPSRWAVCPLGYRYDVALGKMLDEKRITGQHLAPYLRNVDVQWDRINVDELPTMDFHPGERERYQLLPGDLLVCEGGEVGRAAVWRGQLPECYYQKALHRLRPRARSRDTARYVFYLLRAAVALELFTGSEGRSTIAHLTAETLRGYRFPFPTLIEQKTISDFLDHETTKIDALVAEQQRLIELLKEKRQAVISHAVTKGLDPNVPMKDSGVEWPDVIPAHWEVDPIKHLLQSMEQGWSPQCDNFPAESGEWGVLKVGCVNGGRFRPEENKALPDGLTALPELGVQSGDLLISRANTRELVGSAAVAEADFPNLMICDKLYRLRCHLDRAEPQFLALALSAPLARKEIELQATGASASMLNIAQSTIRELRLPVPPLHEQRAILLHIADFTKGLDALVSEAQTAIGFLQERRAALISAAVTGKIDVLGWQSGESDTESDWLQAAEAVAGYGR